MKIGKREVPPDFVLIAELTKTMRIWHTSLPGRQARFGDERGHLFLVADGMGGRRGGEQASALAVVAIQQFTLNTLKWFFEASQTRRNASSASFRRRSVTRTSGSAKKPRSMTSSRAWARP